MKMINFVVWITFQISLSCIASIEFFYQYKFVKFNLRNKFVDETQERKRRTVRTQERRRMAARLWRKKEEKEMNESDGTFRLRTNFIRQLLFFTRLISNEGVPPANCTMMKDIRVIDVFPSCPFVDDIHVKAQLDSQL